MKKQDIIFFIGLFFIFLLIGFGLLMNGCVSSTEKESKEYIGVWTAQTEKYFPGLEKNIVLKMTISIMENKTFVATGKARLSEGDPETTIFVKNGSWDLEGSKLLFSALNCSYYDGNSLAAAPCEDPISVIEIMITNQVWTWIEEDGFTLTLVKEG